MTDAKTVCVPVEAWRFHDGSVKGPADGSADLFDFITADGREYRAQKQPNFWHLVSLWRPHADSGEINWKAEYEAVCGLRIQEKMTPAQPVSPSEGEATEYQLSCSEDCRTEFAAARLGLRTDDLIAALARFNLEARTIAHPSATERMRAALMLARGYLVADLAEATLDDDADNISGVQKDLDTIDAALAEKTDV